MRIPGISLDEAARLRSLHTLQILDTEAEERFDRLTRLAKRLFDVPIALVSLVDENRQWFKSCMGLDATETPRDISFCGHAILGDKIFLVEDASKDERFSDNPLVTGDPNIRFYAGCPIKHSNGYKLGTLCIIDRKAKHLADEDLAALQDLASLVEKELEAIQLATLDELTQISNRRGFIQLSQYILNVCERQNVPAALVFFDLNGFKKINDQLGHAEGDKALKVFAKQMTATFRNSDLFARVGGDEFVLLLTNTPINNVQIALDRFRNNLNNSCKELELKYTIDYSYGVSAIDFDEKLSMDKLLKKVDALMYQQKKSSK